MFSTEISTYVRCGSNAEVQAPNWAVRFTLDSVAKVVLQEVSKFWGPLARSSCNDLRDLVALRQIHGRLR
jgi:hypothetical protein